MKLDVYFEISGLGFRRLLWLGWLSFLTRVTEKCAPILPVTFLFAGCLGSR